MGVMLLTCSCSRRAQHLFDPESVEIVLPSRAGKVTFTRVGRHAYGSEYSRTISLDAGDGGAHPLALNTGWETQINVYWIDENGKRFVRLADRGGEYLLDVQLDKLYLTVPFKERLFVGEFTTDKPMVSGGGPPDDPSAAQIFVDGIRAKPIESLVANWTGDYLGAVAGGTGKLEFWPADVRGETPVKKLDSEIVAHPLAPLPAEHGKGVSDGLRLSQ